MPRVYELPTHLDVQDTLLFGLTARQLVRLAVGASVAYAIWNQTAPAASSSEMRFYLCGCHHRTASGPVEARWPAA
jgi:hypothetical protein